MPLLRGAGEEARLSALLALDAHERLLSSVAEAEIETLARRQAWGEGSRARLARLRAGMTRISAGEGAVVAAWVALASAPRRGGEIGANDLWIAATALAAGAALATCDTDFLRLRGPAPELRLVVMRDGSLRRREPLPGADGFQYKVALYGSDGAEDGSG